MSLFIADAAGSPPVTVELVRAVPGRGLEGDRYFLETGTYSARPDRGREVTLIELEALQGLEREYAVAIDPRLARRNILTAGVALNHLIDREFEVGEARLRGVRLCEPCAHLERLTTRGVLRGLVHRGGLRAQIVSGGLIRVGDPVVVP